jgi:hypothetical protein
MEKKQTFVSIVRCKSSREWELRLGDEESPWTRLHSRHGSHEEAHKAGLILESQEHIAANN